MMRGRRLALLTLAVSLVATSFAQAGTVSIDGTAFRFDGAPTYPGTVAEGLLLNSRMANAIFDDENPATVGRWAYPDSGTWSAERNLNEFIAALPLYASKGLRAVNINLQGGNPVPGCSCDATHAWITSAYNSDGSLKSAWMSRADRAIAAADQHGIVVMLGLFYHGQDQRLASEAALKRAVDEVTDWVLARGHANVLLEIANESNHSLTSFDIVKNRVEELIARAQLRSNGQLAVSSGFLGGWVPSDKVVAQSDYVILHGNGKNASGIQAMIDQVRAKAVYKANPKPIVFNEDSISISNMDAAVTKGASWGYHDPAFQVLPINWSINTSAKQAFFNRVSFYRGVSTQPSLSFTPGSLTIDATQGGAPTTRQVSLQASGGSPSYTITDNAPWLSVDAPMGSTPSSLTVVSDPTGLELGVHTGVVTAKAIGYTDATITVTLTVGSAPAPSGYSLRVSGSPTRSGASPLQGHIATGDIYVFTEPEAGVQEVRFYIDDPMRTRAPYRQEKAAPFDLGGGTLTSARPFDSASLVDGAHTVTALVIPSSGVNVVITATFDVRNSPRSLMFTPASLSFTLRQGDTAASTSISLQVGDNGSPPYTLADDAGWLSAWPASGWAPATIMVSADPSGLSPGSYTGTITAIAADYSSALLTVSLTVAEASTSSFNILVSTSANRAAPRDLDGLAVSGSIYVFTSPDTGVNAVTFYVDDPDRTGSPYRTEKTAPFDLSGGEVALARPFATTALTNGPHTVTAVLGKSDGTSEAITAMFVVGN